MVINDKNVYILSTDRIDNGKASSMGGRAVQLMQGVTDRGYDCTMLLSERCLEYVIQNPTNIMDQQRNVSLDKYDINDPFIWFKGSTKNDILIVQVNAYSKRFDSFKGKVIGDLIAPIMTEAGNNDKFVDICYFADKCDGFIVGNEAQRHYWIGVFAMFGDTWHLTHKPIYVVPMSAMTPNNLIPSLNNRTLMSYGAMYPWIDYKAMISVFEKMDSEYMMCFDGVEHPLYRNDHLKPFYSYIKKLPKALKSRIDINTSWNYTKTIATAGIVLTKYPEYVVANRTRSMSFLSKGIPIITNKGDNIYNILDEGVDSRFIFHNELPIQVIENGIRNNAIWRNEFIEKVECRTGATKVANSLLVAIKGITNGK